jgi:TolA-binding protein
MSIQKNNSSIGRLLIAPFVLVVAGVLLIASIAVGQARSRSNITTQTQNAGEAEKKAFRDGRELLLEENWPRAAERFNDYIADYPKDEKAG